MKHKCKQCFKEYNNQKIGIKIDFGIKMHFCSWKCLGDYAYEMSKEFPEDEE